VLNVANKGAQHVQSAAQQQRKETMVSDSGFNSNIKHKESITKWQRHGKVSRNDEGVV
jgi:hypothetical protein